MKDTIESRMLYTTSPWGKGTLSDPDMIRYDEPAILCHRRDYHQDGSHTDYYFIELSSEEFMLLGGETLKGA